MNRTWSKGVAIIWGILALGIAGWVILHSKVEEVGRPLKSSAEAPSKSSKRDPQTGNKHAAIGVNQERKLERMFPFKRGTEQMYLAVYATYEVDENGHRDDGPPSAPMLSLELLVDSPGGGKRLIASKLDLGIHGSYGQMGEVELKFLGLEHPALVLRGGYTSQGVTVCSAAYYSLFDAWGRFQVEKVLELQETFDDSGMHEDQKRVTSIDSSTQILDDHLPGWAIVKIGFTGVVSRESNGSNQQEQVNASYVFKYDPTKHSFQVQPHTNRDEWWRING